MPASPLSDPSDQPVSQPARSPSTTSDVAQNDPEDANDDASNSVMTMDSTDKELEDARCAVIRLSVNHPEWRNRYRALASLLSKRFGQTNRDALLVECIDIQRQICAVCTVGNPDRAVSVSDLVSSLRTYFKQIGEDSLLAEAISLNREALSLRPSGHPDRSISCIDLAASLWTRFNQTGEQSLLTEAIVLEREALSLRPIGHPDRSISCINLAASLWTHFNQTGEQSLLTEALSLRPIGHPDRFQSCYSLALSLLTRFDQIGEESLLAEAIELHREALSLSTGGHSDRSYPCYSLATSLLAHFNQIGEESLLTEAIELFREALSLRPDRHPDRSLSCNGLAISLGTRFNQTGEESLLAEAIGLFREALFLQPSGYPGRYQSCNNLALSLWTCFNQTGEELLLAEAIDLLREAISLQPSGHPDQSAPRSNLARALSAHFKQAKEESLLVEAIHLHREALSLQNSGHPHRLEACNRLVTSLRAHFELTGDESILLEAIDISQNAMNTQPQCHPSRWRPIIDQVHIYLNDRFSRHNTILAIDYIQQALSIVSDDWPTLLSEVAQLTSLIDLPVLSHHSLLQLLHCFSAAMDLASRVAGYVLNPQSQLRYLNSSKHLGPRAYWCAVACGQPELGLELIERARALIWTQALHMRNPQLSGAPPELASELEVLLRRMQTLRVAEDPMSLSSHDQDRRYKDSDRIHHLIQQIRALPGQERFMRGLSSRELAQCASLNIVVTLVATEGECHALILQADNQKPVMLKLSNIAPDELTAMSIIMASVQRRGAAPDSGPDDYRGMKASQYKGTLHQTCSDPVLEKLWTTVVKPVIDYLRLEKASGSSRPRLHWCPTGPFVFLPLHAAGIYDGNSKECCTDYVVSSYTPTLTNILRAQKSNPSFLRHDAKLGLIAAMHAWDASLPALPNVEQELSGIRAAAERANVSVNGPGSCVGNAAVMTDAAEVFKSTNMVHIACHSKQNAADALSSGFCLSDATFSISRLMNLELNDALFAFLSTCETAKGDEKQPDQTIHLAAAMLFVGFRSVVATMWAMEVVDGPLVAKLFYERLFTEKVITLDAIPYALDYAVSELRKSGVPPRRWATFIHLGA